MTRVVRQLGRAETTPPTLQVRCPTCRRFLPAPAERTGMVRACPHCGQLLWIGWWDWYGRAFANLPMPPEVSLPSDTGEYLLRRAAATGLDLLVWTAGVLVLLLLPRDVFPPEPGPRWTVMLSISWSVLPLLAWWCGGRSPGKWLLGLQVVNASSAGVDLWRLILRDMAKLIVLPVAVLWYLLFGGWVRVLQGDASTLAPLLTLHDRIMFTEVSRDP